MMRRFGIVLLAGIIACLTCCKQAGSFDGDVICGDDAVDMPFESVATDISLHVLECDRLVDAFDAAVIGDNLFVLDSELSQLWCFQDNRLVSTLAAQGRGHGEYSLIADFDYLPENGTLFIVPREANVVLKYEYPSMRYAGQYAFDGYIHGLRVVDGNTFIVRCNTDSLSNIVALWDASTGKITETLQLTSAQNLYFEPNYSLHNPFRLVSGLADFTNRLGWFDENGEFTELYSFRYSDGKPKDIYSISSDTEDFSLILKRTQFETQKHFFSNVVMPLVTEDGFSFWYCNNNGPEGDDSWLWLYNKTAEGVLQAKNLSIPGLNFVVQPMGVTQDGRYFTIFSGPSDMIEDPNTSPSALARQILDAVNSQKDDNPVILYFRIK